MDAKHAAAMWSDAGVGMAAQRIVMKCFILCFGHKFTAPKASTKKLAVHAVPPIVGRMQCMDLMLDCWHKDLVVPQIGKEHKIQPAGFSCETLDFVIGADHGQGSFCAGVKVICREQDCSVAATAVHRLREIECKKDTGNLFALAVTPKLNAALKRIVVHQRIYERNDDGKPVSDGKLSICRKAMEGNIASKPSVLSWTGPAGH
jgi:hypothetical protein